jgi:type IV pilus assembly protein PilB
MQDHARIAEALVKRGLLSREQIDRARDEVKRTGLPFERVLSQAGLLTEDAYFSAHAATLGVPYMDLSAVIVDPDVVRYVPADLARKHKMVPLFKIGATLTVAMTDPQDIVALDDVRAATGMESIDPVLATPEGISRILETYFGARQTVDEVVKSIGRAQGKEGAQSLIESVEDPPVIRLIDSAIAQAVKEKASDIHIEPEIDVVRIRFRVDGVLREINTVPRELQEALISRVKILAKIDIAETRKPQDGRIRLKVQDKDIDIRVSTFPTIHGENLVLRLLDKSALLRGLEDAIFSPRNLAQFERLIRQPHGIVLVTGPTGSGKTTTLYAALSRISSMEKNIVTIEDPVEYELPLIRQTQVNPKADITFANGLRSILRQDPDVIMVGEIRDRETSEIAIQASLTGHLVLSTLHTNDAPTSLTRLEDMGVEPFLISSSVTGVLAQRLVRALCPACKETYIPTPGMLEKAGLEKDATLHRGKGCPQCRMTGYAGRFGICELLVVNDQIRKMINEKKPADELRVCAQESGMQSLLEDGLEKVRRGLTTLEEVMRVTVTEQ